MSTPAPTMSIQDTRSLSPADRGALERIRALTPSADPLGLLPDVPPARIPRHIAIIMDGNGRWAAQRGFPRVFGHRNGAASVRTVLEAAAEVGIEVLTLYSFSSENWKRPRDEVAHLMALYAQYLDGERAHLRRENIRFRQIGDRAGLPTEAVEALERMEEATADCTGITLCLAVNYGSRAEMTRAARRLGERVRAGELEPGDIDETAFARELDTAGLVDPDLLIRTAGEMRLSNYLLWQVSYAELFVTDVLWPDFGREALHDAIRAFAQRERRFGDIERSERASGGDTMGSCSATASSPG